ncbi:MAG: phosphatase PAP2 family protein [Gemmatimonadota bacterium]|nr:phosphatase PAP2 family protein [Gemmatimonadota bacterium]
MPQDNDATSSGFPVPRSFAPSSLAAAWRRLWREEWLFFALVMAYAASGYAADFGGYVPGMMRARWSTPTDLILPVLAAWVVFGHGLRWRWRLRDANGGPLGASLAWRRAWREVRRTVLTPDRILRVVAIYGAVRLLLDTYTRWKGAIPTLHPFAWDGRLSDWDVRLHFGQAPWAWLHPMLGHPTATRVLDALYWMWVPTVMLVVLWLAWNDRAALRAQFLLTFALAWIVLGTLMAAMMSSGGPCYFARITGAPGPYAGLMAYLNTVHTHSPLGAVAGQEWLWGIYTAHESRLYAGISAMPSMHVAMPVLYTLMAARLDRRLGFACGAFACLILVAAVHLGWHYAIDGYVSALALWGLWAASGRLMMRSSRA